MYPGPYPIVQMVMLSLRADDGKGNGLLFVRERKKQQDKSVNRERIKRKYIEDTTLTRINAFRATSS